MPSADLFDRWRRSRAAFLAMRALARYDSRKQNMELEVKLLLQNSGMKFQREYQFCERKWRFDFAIPSKMIAIECEGVSGSDPQGVGGHRTMSGFIKDVEKYNRAAMEGWTVLRVIPDWAWGRHGTSGKNPCSTTAIVDYVAKAQSFTG